MRPIGSVVSLTYDSRVPVEQDDVIQTRTGRSYRCLANRIQQRGKWKGRQHITALVIDACDVSPDDTVHRLVWYER